jgi:hypothetical protein
MQFLVTVDGSEVGAGLPPEQAVQIREQLVGPSLEKLTLMGGSKDAGAGVDACKWCNRAEPASK